MQAETLLILVLGAVAVIVAVHWVAARTGLPEAALLTLCGIAYAVLPGPNIAPCGCGSPSTCRSRCTCGSARTSTTTPARTSTAGSPGGRSWR